MTLPSLPSLLSLGAAHSWNVSLVLLLIKATLILIAALGITLAMQRASAGARHLVWLVTLVALVLIPALTAWRPLRLEILPAIHTAAVSSPRTTRDRMPSTEPMSTLGDPTIGSAAVAVPTEASSSSVTPGDEAGAGVLASVRNASVWTLLLAVWGVVALAIVALLTWSALTVRRLVRRSQPLDTPSWLNPLWEVSDRLGLAEPPRLLLSHDAKMPFACGVLTPTIVLPAECETWSAERRLAVLLHELAHVRRHDMIGHTLGRLVCAVYWFHPLVWTAARQLRSESERACDDMALACGTRAADYAEHLLDIVTSVRHGGTPMVALAMARRKEFEGRMLAILDPELRHSTPSRRQSASLIATLAVISIVVGAAAPAPKRTPAMATVANTQSAANAQPAALDTTPSATEPATRETAAVSSVVEAASRETGGRVVLQSGGARLDSDEQMSMTVISSPTPTPTPAPRPSPRPSPAPAEVTVERQMDIPMVVGVAMDKVYKTAKSEILDKASKIDMATVLRGALSAPKKEGQADDRPVLLAKVLRTDTSATLRRVAAWGLNEYAEQNVAAEALANALRRDANEGVREMAAWSLGQGNDLTIAVEALRAALHSDASVAVRRTAAWAIGSLEDEGAVSTLVGALNDADPTVRTRAIWALGNIEPNTAPKPLIALLADKDPRVRELTAWALFHIEDPAAVPALQAALRAEKDSDLQLKYIRALAALGEKSVDALRDLLESSDPRVKSMAVHALAGGHAAGPWPHPMPQPRPSP